MRGLTASSRRSARMVQIRFVPAETRCALQSAHGSPWHHPTGLRPVHHRGVCAQSGRTDMRAGPAQLRLAHADRRAPEQVARSALPVRNAAQTARPSAPTGAHAAPVRLARADQPQPHRPVGPTPGLRGARETNLEELGCVSRQNSVKDAAADGSRHTIEFIQRGLAGGAVDVDHHVTHVLKCAQVLRCDIDAGG